MSATYLGMYRGIVEDTQDPEERKRYRVRVVPIFPDDIPTKALPWAELCVFGGRSFGDLPHYAKDDRVWVSFEGGDRRFPVIVGGWLSDYTGMNDIPSELTEDYATTQERWLRMDRKGNKMLMSPLPDESGVYIESGSNFLEVRQHDDTILLKSNKRIILDAPKVDITGEVTANVQGNLTAHVQQSATIRGEDKVSVQSSGAVYIGRYEDPVGGFLLPNTTPEVSIEATDKVSMAATGAAGTIDVDAQGDITVDTPTNIIVTGTQKVSVVSSSLIEVSAPSVTLDATTTLDLTSAATINTSAATTLNATATDLVVNASNSVSLTTNDITVANSGELKVTSGGDIAIKATNLGGGATTMVAEAGAVNIIAKTGNISCTAPANATVSVFAGTIDLTGTDLRANMSGQVSLVGQSGASITTLGVLTLDGLQGINIG